jgi:AcrR family transcriptional regulator
MTLYEGPARTTPDQTRSRILAAAREIFALKGTRGTTTREVADRADVNEATLFRHFGTKQALLRDMLEHYCGSTSYLRTVLGSLKGPLAEQLRVLGHAGIDGIKAKADLIRIAMAEQVTDPDAITMTWRGPHDALRLLSEFMRARIAAGQLRGDPDVLARIFMSFWFAYVFGRKIWGEAADEPAARDAAVKYCVDVFLNGANVQ